MQCIVFHFLQPEFAATHINENFCGSSENIGIRSRYPLQTETNLTSSKFLATSLALWIHEGKTVAIIGTHTGQVLKVSSVFLGLA